jgi:hypothetical protein
MQRHSGSQEIEFENIDGTFLRAFIKSQQLVL